MNSRLSRQSTVVFSFSAAIVIALAIVVVKAASGSFVPTWTGCYNAASGTINKLQQGTPAATPQQIQAKVDQFDDQKKAYDRKGEDAKANYARRRGELLGPLQEDVGKALDAFGKAHGIMMILDGSQVPLVYTADGVDVTKAFIAEYNSKNPATTTAATPRP